MSSLLNALKFQKFSLGQSWKQAMHDPWRAVIGSGDRYSTSVWNKILGRHDDPAVDQWGGPPKQHYKQAEAEGMPTGAGRTYNNVARLFVVAGSAGSAVGGVNGAAGGAAGAGGVAEGGAGGSLGGTLSYEGASTGAPSLANGISTSLDAGVTSAGSGGIGSAGGLSGSSAASSGGLAKFQNAMSLLQQQGSQSDEPQHRAEIYQQDPYLQSLLTSSKRAKTAAKGGVREAMDRGMSGDNPIDANGVQVLQIQQMIKRVIELNRLVTQLERKRARKV